jgi:hypothetical protein
MYSIDAALAYLLGDRECKKKELGVRNQQI